MILYFTNRTMEILGHASTDLPEGFVIIDDLKTEDVEAGVATFTCKIGFDVDSREQLEKMTDSGNYILRKNDSENEFYTIIDTEIDTKSQEIYVYAEDAGLDLLNEIAEAYEATEAHTAEWYVNKWILDSGFEIGINEIPASSTRTLSWDGESTVTERLASIATKFGDYEVSYSYDIKGTVITNKYVNIYEKRGKDNGAKLRLNRDIDRIVTKKSVANLATALKCTGGTPEDSEEPITLAGYEYDDGDFFVDGDGILRSRNANAKWSRYVWNKEPNKLNGYSGYITRTYSYDTTSQAALFGHALAELKSVCEMEVNYEVDITNLPEDIKIGDRIDIIDDAGGLYLSSRILLLETSVTNSTQMATIGENLIKDDGISLKVQELAVQFAESAKNAEKTKLLAEAAKATATNAQKQAEQAASDLAAAESNLAAVTSRVDATEAEIAEAQAAVTAAQTAADSALNRTNQYGTCSTAAATATKVVALSGFVLYKGATVHVKFTYANTASSAALNVNSTGAKYIRAYGAALTSSSAYNWVAGSTVTFVYDGTYWQISDAAALAKANTANTNAANAAKVATNYIDFIDDTGLVIGDMTAETLGKNVLIDSDSIEIRNGSTILASFSEELIDLGISSQNAVISLCGGNGTISFETRTFKDEICESLIVRSEHGVSVNSNTLVSLFVESTDTITAAQILVESHKVTAWTEYIELDTYVGIDMRSSDYIDMYSAKETSIRSGTMILFDAPDGIHIPNSQRIYSVDANGADREIMRLNNDTTNPTLIVGDGLYSASIGATNISAGTTIRLLTSAERVILENSSESTYSAHFRPNSNAKCTLGTPSYKWYAVYASNSTIQTSDKREKENIMPLGNDLIKVLSDDGESEVIDLHSALFDRLQPVQYNFINGNKKTCYGLIAQDVLEVMRDLEIGENELDLIHHDFWKDEETGETTETYGIAYTNLIALLIYEVQKLKAEVATLKTA